MSVTLHAKKFRNYKKKLILIITLVITGVLFSSNTNDELLFNIDDVFVPCYVNVTSSEYNQLTDGYITTTTTYYLGEVDYGNHGVNVAACEGRADRFVRNLIRAIQP